MDNPDIAPESWRRDVDFLRGVALFNRGDYWEAHEIWEQRWLQCAHESQRTLLKALIQLAASRIKHEQHNLRGAALLLDKARQRLRGLPRFFMGLDVAALETSLQSEGALVLDLGDPSS